MYQSLKNVSSESYFKTFKTSEAICVNNQKFIDIELSLVILEYRFVELSRL